MSEEANENANKFWEHQKKMFKNYKASRAPSGHLQPAEGDVRVFFGYIVNQSRNVTLQPPEWFMDTYEALADDEMDVAEVRKACIRSIDTLREFVDATTEPMPMGDTIIEYLDHLGWKDIPKQGRVACLAMLGMGLIARTFLVTRQMFGLGHTKESAFQSFVNAGGAAFRIYEEDIDPLKEGRDYLRFAVHHAVHLGLSRGQVEQLVGQFVLEELNEYPDVPVNHAEKDDKRGD